MPLTLVHRAGVDTVGKLEAAGSRRYREAESLFNAQQPLGAIYLFGYSVEVRLKVAYYRSIGLVSTSVIQGNVHRKPAEDAINGMFNATPRLPPGPSPGHHVIGWARLLEQTRAANGTPLAIAIADQMHAHAQNLFLCWVEFLRYRGNKPYDMEVQAVRFAARWFRANARRLWN